MTEQKEREARNTVAAFQIDKDTKKVETLNGFTLEENGVRVYSPSNKPTASELGAFPVTGGSNIDLVSGSMNSPDGANILDIHGNGSTFISALNSATFGFNSWFRDGGWRKQDVNRPSARFAIHDGGFDIFASDAGSSDASQHQYPIYHKGNKPTAKDVGAAPDGFGLGTFGKALLATSCDDAMDSGFYSINSDTTETPYGKGPSGATMISTKWGSGAGASQLFFNYTSDRVHFRRRSGSVWQPWREIYHTGRLPSATDVGALPITGGTLSGDLYVTSGGVSNKVYHEGFKPSASAPALGEIGSYALMRPNELRVWPGVIMEGSKLAWASAGTPNSEVWGGGNGVYPVISGSWMALGMSNNDGTDGARGGCHTLFTRIA